MSDGDGTTMRLKEMVEVLAEAAEPVAAAAAAAIAAVTKKVKLDKKHYQFKMGFAELAQEKMVHFEAMLCLGVWPDDTTVCEAADPPA